jgi:hypothetical protein
MQSVGHVQLFSVSYSSSSSSVVLGWGSMGLAGMEDGNDRTKAILLSKRLRIILALMGVTRFNLVGTWNPWAQATFGAKE